MVFKINMSKKNNNKNQHFISKNIVIKPNKSNIKTNNHQTGKNNHHLRQNNHHFVTDLSLKIMNLI